MKKFIMIFSVILVVVVVASLAFWIAGGIGIIFVAPLLVAIGLKFLTYLNLLNLPSPFKGMVSTVIFVSILAILVIGGYKKYQKYAAEAEAKKEAGQTVIQTQQRPIKWKLYKKVSISGNRLSDPIALPFGKSRIVPELDEEVALILSNGPSVDLNAYDQVDLGKAKSFRAIGKSGKDATLYIFKL